MIEEILIETTNWLVICALFVLLCHTILSVVDRLKYKESKQEVKDVQ